MKKILYILALIATVTLVGCNQELLDTTPTDEVSSETLLTDAAGAQVAVSGIYAAMYQYALTNWAAENPGILARTLASDVMGEDNYILGAGNQWFWYDHLLDTDGDYQRSYGRQGQQWSLYYTLISQANYIIAKEEILVAEGFAGQDVVAQAYAIRAFSYMMLAEWFCQGNVPENKDNCPGVPIYTKPTSMDTEDQPRGTLAELYAQINADYKAAYDLFKVTAAGGYVKTHVSHIDLYTTCLLWARTALAEGEWQRAYDMATEALTKPNLVRVESVKAMTGFNDSSLGNVLWGFQIVTDQTGPYGPFISHIDPFNGGYCTAEKKCFCPYLATSIPETDERWAWIDTTIAEGHFVSVKFLYKDVATSVADNILARAEEAILIAAEAACRLGKYAESRALLLELGGARDTAYAERLAAREDSALFNDDTKAALANPRTLMDEILWQRRVELWCEGYGRLFDLRRLNLGYERDIDGEVAEPGDLRFTILIPQKEFDNNQALKISEDQNPR